MRQEGEERLKELSRRPHTSSNKISEHQEKLFLNMRNERKLGVRRVQSEQISKARNIV